MANHFYRGYSNKEGVFEVEAEAVLFEHFLDDNWEYLLFLDYTLLVQLTHILHQLMQLLLIFLHPKIPQALSSPK